MQCVHEERHTEIERSLETRGLSMVQVLRKNWCVVCYCSAPLAHAMKADQSMELKTDADLLNTRVLCD